MPSGVYTRIKRTKDKPLSERQKEVLAKMSKTHIGTHLSEEAKRKLSKWHTGRPMSIEHCLHTSQAKRGKSLSPYAKDAKQKTEKRKWQNPEYRNRERKLMMAGMHAHPNKPETLLAKLADIACPDEYQFTGNGEIVIDGLCPDLFNINNKKKVILMHGDYWHMGENIQIVIDRYFQFGYDCLVIWEKELKDRENVIAKIREFNNRIRIHHPEISISLNRQSNMFDILETGD